MKRVVENVRRPELFAVRCLPCGVAETAERDDQGRVSIRHFSSDVCPRVAVNDLYRQTSDPADYVASASSLRRAADGVVTILDSLGEPWIEIKPNATP